ncbi:MAG: hypothetical protein N2511_01030 [Thermodesulfovibrionales bacterium]|nr:hypothetical protein [Thermodesulfovibrionales bacterium]
MRIISRSLSNLAIKALNRVLYEFGEGYGLKVMGAWLSVEKDRKGDPVAIFYSSTFEDYFDLDIVEISLKFYVGELEKPYFTPPIEVVKNPIETWKNKQRELINSFKEILISQGKDETEATLEAMFLGSNFSAIREGTTYKCYDSDRLKNIIEMAIKEHKSIEVRIEKVNLENQDKYLLISLLKVDD